MLLVIVCWLLTLGKDIFVPAVQGAVIVYVIGGLAQALERLPEIGGRLPVQLRYLFSILLIGIVFSLLAYLVLANKERALALAPQYQHSLLASVGSMLVTLIVVLLYATFLLVAVSPPVAARIGFACPDAAAVRSALASWIAGDLIKFHVFYPRAFWRDAGLSGAAAIADTYGLSVLDTSLEVPRLTAFLGGTLARDWPARPLAQRERLLQDALVRAFGAEAGNPTAWHETVWIDHPWYGGAYHAHLCAGADPDAMRRLMEQSGRIRFAAAELTHHFNGYLEGALCSGERALAGVCVRRDDSTSRASA